MPADPRRVRSSGAMPAPNRREFLELAGALGASLAWGAGCARSAPLRYTPRPEHFPQGVASGDPDEHSVILWTRRPPLAGSAARQVTVEVADDRARRERTRLEGTPSLAT
jgi:alkaline phosphatase D